MQKGSVRWFNDTVGYGFIDYAGGSAFVHYSAVQATGHRTLLKDEQVEFTLTRDDQGRPKALAVWRSGEEPA